MALAIFIPVLIISLLLGGAYIYLTRWGVQGAGGAVAEPRGAVARAGSASPCPHRPHAPGTVLGSQTPSSRSGVAGVLVGRRHGGTWEDGAGRALL